VEITVLIGYISVSTNDQNIDLQRDALQSANCEQIFADKITGTSIERPGLNRATHWSSGSWIGLGGVSAI